MNIITPYPVYYMNREKGFQKRLDDNLYYNLDSSSNVRQIKAFQDWMDVKHPSWVNGSNLNKNAGAGYGTFGPSTTAAWNSYGNEFMTQMGAIASGIATPFNSSASTQAPATSEASPNTTNQSAQASQNTSNQPASTTSPATTPNSAPPKAGMSKKTKIMIAAGSVFVLLLVVVIVAKSNSK